MILADTSVWIDHLRKGDRDLERALQGGFVLTHPFVIGELALGHLRDRALILDRLRELPMARVATDDEVFHLIEREQLFGRGIGYVDAHLLAAARLSGNAEVWTRDRPLREAAKYLALSHVER